MTEGIQSGRKLVVRFRGLCVLVLALAFCVWPSAAQEQPDWLALVRERIAARDLPAALQITEQRLVEAPQDYEARGWHGRVLAWSGRWAEAENEYRQALESAPNDVDILVGLSDVLAWQQRFAEALAPLDHARQLEPGRTEIHIRRGQVLRALGREATARAAFREALILEPSDPDARAGLSSLQGEFRNEFRIGTDFDFFNYTDASKAVTLSLRSRLNPRWTGNIAGTFQNRFEQQTGRFLASISYQLDRHSSITVGGGAGRHRGVIPKGETFFEYNRGFNFGRQHFVRGVELTYGQRWLWFQDARILVLSPGAIFYLPKDFTWSVQIPVARSRFPGLAAQWRPSGITRLTFPVRRTLTGNVFYAVGTENFAQVDQVGRFSARTWGGGVRHQFNARQDVTAYVLYQDRSQGRNQTSFGITYGIRF